MNAKLSKHIRRLARDIVDYNGELVDQPTQYFNTTHYVRKGLDARGNLATVKRIQVVMREGFRKTYKQLKQENK